MKVMDHAEVVAAQDEQVNRLLVPVTALLATGAGMVAGILPARKAASLAVLQAISTDR